MNLKFAYWYFNNALDKKFCKKIINHALKKQKLLGLVGEDKPKKTNIPTLTILSNFSFNSL